MSHKKVALIYDWLDTSLGGAEKVLEALCDLYPNADIFTAFATQSTPPFLVDRTIKTSFLQRLPFLWCAKHLLAPIMPLAFELLDVTAYDLVISVSSFAAKSVVTRVEQTHVCYLLTPTRFLFSHVDAYCHHGKNNWLIKRLRRYDYIAARRPDYIIPISNLVKSRALEFYNLETLPPLYPPVNARKIVGALKKTDTALISAPPSSYDLVVSRHVPYKKIDLAIQTCCQLKRPLKIVGVGKCHRQLVALARRLDPHHQYIEFLGRVSDAHLLELYRHAQVFLMPGREDFGIAALEAAAAGIFVFLQHDSGAAELLSHQTASFHLREESIAALLDAYSWFKTHQSQINHSQIKEIALQYDVLDFKKNFLWNIKNLNEPST